MPNPNHVPAGSSKGGQFAKAARRAAGVSTGELLNDLAMAQGSKLDSSTFPPSLTITQDLILYHATTNVDQVKRKGLSPSLPPEIAEEGDDQMNLEGKGVYLTTKEKALRYLEGRLSDNGGVVSVFIPEGSILYQDPIDIGSVFYKGKIPARGINSERK